MPKKGKVISKEESQKIREKASLSQEEMNTLEQRLERDKEKIDSPELKEVLNEQKTESFSSPSLKKVNAPQRNPVRLETDLNETPVTNSNQTRTEEENGINYTQKMERTEEPKYVPYQGKFIDNIIPKREIENIGIDQPFNKREIAFESSQQSRIGAQESLEKYSPVRKGERDKIGKEKSFEKREIKYTHEKY